uniref:RNase H type-1 domain-containing protein n=1 Tax=Fagus sylvatica TaxID=28930 RepID=A0A2N9EYA9_FAGSY
MPPKLRQRGSRREVSTQGELAEAIKQLKEKDAGVKTLPQNEGGNQEKPHQDSGSHNKETTFVTMSDVTNLLKQEREKNPKEPRLFGNALVHISKFIDSMGAYAGNGDLCLREFSKSLDDRAYTWYTTLPPGSVKVWEDMVELFCGKYFQTEEKITLVNLHTTKQASVEDLLHYIHRFRDISLDCCANYEEGELVGVCIDNMLSEFQAHLENLNISRFAQLLQKTRKTALSVKPHTEKPKEKKSQPQVLMVSTHKDRAVVSVVIHGNASDVDMEMEESATAKARIAATEAIMAIAADSGAHCFTVETHASRAFLETTNAITFTDEDMEVQYPDHRRPLYLSATINEVQVRRALVDTGSCINLIPLSTIQAVEISQKKIQGAPMEIKGFDGVGEYTKGHIQLVLKVGPIVALTRFQVVDSMVPITYYWEDLGCTNTSSFPPPITNEEIKDASETDLRDLLERKKKRKAEASTSKSQPQCPSCFTVNEADVPESADTAETAAADPKISAKEEFKVIDLNPELVAHSLNVEPGTRPVVQPIRTFHPEVEVQIAQEVKKLLSAGFIKPIQHPRWLSNIVPVKKKNGQIQCYVDFRNLNKACPKDEFPLPNMDLLIDSAAGHAMFSFMDGFSGYNQIFMSPKDAEKTAFRTPIGNFYYTVMPFGLKNAGATYQRTMTAMFHDMMHREIEDYVDDIVVKSKTRKDHFGILKKVFERCRLYKLKMNPLKCAFGVSAGKFLGFLVHQHGIDVDPTRASAIATMKPPTTHKELKSFLGKLSYIRRLAQWLLQLSQYEIITETPTAIKSQAIADLLAQFPREDNSSILDEVPGEINEVFLVGLADFLWTLKFDGSSTAASAGAGIVLYKDDGEAVTKSFKFDFPCSNNAAEYEAYLAGLAIAYEMRIKHLRVIGDSNLVVCQARGEFSLKEPSLAPYRALAQKLEAKFSTFEIEHAQRNENRYADALATLGS